MEDEPIAGPSTSSNVVATAPRAVQHWMEDAFGFEVNVDCAQSALNALQGGAWQLQLSKGLSIGGLTSNLGLLKFVNQINPHVRTSVMVRPRTGDFVYTETEHNAMLTDIDDVYTYGGNDVVVGCLTENYDIDTDKCVDILGSARSMSVTFSRAFDLTRNPRNSLERLIELGFTRVLTSGCRPNCFEGALYIRELMKQAEGRIIIVPSGGINADNLETIMEITESCHLNVSAGLPRYPALVTPYSHGLGKPFGLLYEECSVGKVSELLSIAKRLWGI